MGVACFLPGADLPKVNPKVDMTALLVMMRDTELEHIQGPGQHSHCAAVALHRPPPPRTGHLWSLLLLLHVLLLLLLVPVVLPLAAF